MVPRGIPGGALAVVRERRLVYARSYGLADREKGIAATPETLFRIASLSKPITAVAILKLVDQGRLALDSPAWKILALEPPAAANRTSTVAPARHGLRCATFSITQAGGTARRASTPCFRASRSRTT